MDAAKWNAYLAIGRKVESGGAGDDVSRDPADLAMQQGFVERFRSFLPPPARVLAPGAVTEAVMLAEAGYKVHALVFGRDNVRYLNEQAGRLPPQSLFVRERDAHDLDYVPGHFDGYFSVQFHEHLIAPFVHIGEVRHCMRDGGIVFVDACGTTNPAQFTIWHTNLEPEAGVAQQWDYWGFAERWRGAEGDDRPQFVFEKLPMDHPDFKHRGYIHHIMALRASLPQENG